jgi:Fanconi anemia group J protein
VQSHDAGHIIAVSHLLPSGKSLALLVSALAWQQSEKARSISNSVRTPSTSSPVCIIDDEEDDVFEPAKVFRRHQGIKKEHGHELNATNAGGECPCRIFICSRTHAQLSQLVKSLKSTVYAPSMAVLGSRDQMCINPTVMRSQTKNEDCSKLVGGGNKRGCSFFQSANILASHSSMRVAWDIEDIVSKGHEFHACPYFTAHLIAQRADVVFCPYNFLIDKLIREAAGIQLMKNIVIFDEAHNIEDQCREAASFVVTSSLVTLAINMILICQKFPNCPAEASSLHVALDQVRSWVHVRAQEMRRDPAGGHILEYVAETVPAQFTEMGLTNVVVKELVSKSCTLKEWHKEVIELSEARTTYRWVCPDDGKVHSVVPAFSSCIRTVDMILLVAGYAHESASDYAISMQRKSSEAECVVNLWCLNPAVAFKDLREQCRSVVLVSGTLSPMDSFSSELTCDFPIRLQAPHVIDCTRQVMCNYMPEFNLSFRGSDSPVLHQRLGQLIIDVCSVTPNGVLVFCSSYWWIDMLCQQWRANGQWDTLNSIKSIYTEPKFNDQHFTSLLLDYQAAACTIKGAVMIAVCRGKISEGLDLSDRQSRAVLILGVPFLGATDRCVQLKRDYNSRHCTVSSLLDGHTASLVDGNTWYKMQAFRAANQAIGRCIRHKSDYGSVIFVDSRFGDEDSIGFLPKWIRSQMMKCNARNIGLKLQSFFTRMASEFPLKSDVIDAHVAMPLIGRHISLKKARQPDDDEDGKSKRGSIMQFFSRQCQ